MNKHIKTSLLLLCLLGLGIFFDRAGFTGRAAKISKIFFPVIGSNIPAWIGPEGGSVVVLVIDPVNPAIHYAGTWGAGVYKSIDNGVSWQPSSQGLGNLYINSMAIDPHHPEIVFAGTYKGGIYRSTNTGLSWTAVNAGIQDQAIVYSMIVHPVYSNLVYASTRGISNNGSYPWKGVLYSSKDGGLSWTPSLVDVPTASQQDWVYSIDIEKVPPNLIFAATHEYGVYRSKDSGASWERVIDGLNDWSTRTIASDSVNGIVYSGFWHTGGVYLSDDQGDHWTLANPSIGGKKIYNLTIDPIQPKNIFLATFNDGLIRTTDGFDTFKTIGPLGDKFYTIAVNPKNDQNISTGTVGDGIWSSQDGGENWAQSSKGLKATSAVSVLFNGNQIYTAVYGEGVLSLPVTGTTWSQSNLNLPDRFLNGLIQDPVHPNMMYALTDFSGLYKKDMNSSSSGWSYTGLNLPPASYSVGHNPSLPLDNLLEDPDWVGLLGFQPNSTTGTFLDSLFAMAIAASNPNTMYLGLESSGMYVSLDGGASWNPSGLSGQMISALAVDPRNDQRVYAAGITSNTFHYSTDRGQNWTNVNLPVSSINCIRLSPDNPDLIYAGTTNGLYRKNFATTEDWALIGLNSQSVLSIAFYPGKPSRMLAGTETGVYQTNDSGATWFAAPEQLQGVSVQAISFDPQHPGSAYFGTKARGILHIYIP